MVATIKVYRYDFPPSLGVIRSLIGKGKTNKMNIKQQYQINENDLTSLEIKFDEVESFEHGIKGQIKFQFIVKVPDENIFTDHTSYYYYYIDTALKILILSGDPSYFGDVKSEIALFFNNDLGHIRQIDIFKHDMLKIIKKIISYSTTKDKKYHNLMINGRFHYADALAYEGAKIDTKTMYETGNMRCISTTSDFKKKFEICEQFDTIMRIYKCAGILNEQSFKSYKLKMRCDSEFIAMFSPGFDQWILFVLHVCKDVFQVSKIP